MIAQAQASQPTLHVMEVGGAGGQGGAGGAGAGAGGAAGGEGGDGGEGGAAGQETMARPFDVLMDTFSLHEFMIRKVRALC